MENQLQDRRQALAWLTGQLRWELTLDTLRAGTAPELDELRERQAA